MGKVGTPRHHDLMGQRFGRLVVIAESTERSAARGMRWVCQCDCGKKKVIDALALRRGVVVSCGCYMRERVTERATIHGHNRRYVGKSPTYISWEKMLSRCDKPRDPAYPRYGGRGIVVCERWHKFANFLQDMGERPSCLHTIDRIDSDGNYTPENCRWADKETQANNTNRNRRFEYKGEMKTIAELARIAGIAYYTMYGRLVLSGWSVENAVNLPLTGKK